MALLILKIRITSVFSGAISGVSIHKKFSPKGSKIQTDYWLIIMITQVCNFQLHQTLQPNRIEAQNKVNINVFGNENKQFFAIYISAGGHEELNLLLTSDEEKHLYVLIKSFNTKHHGTKEFCMHCLQAFSTKEVLAKHKQNCFRINGKQGIQMPKKGSKVQFQDHHGQMLVLFFVYADFKAITEKVSGRQPSAENSFTDKYQQHTACSYGHKLVCCYDDQYSKPVKIYRGEEPVNKFMHEMLKEVDYCKATIRKYFRKPLVMSDDEEMFKASTRRHICREQYSNSPRIRTWVLRTC